MSNVCLWCNMRGTAHQGDCLAPALADHQRVEHELRARVAELEDAARMLVSTAADLDPVENTLIVEWGTMHELANLVPGCSSEDLLKGIEQDEKPTK